MSSIDRLTRELAKLPGVGKKTALRLCYHLVKGSKEDARNLARSLVDMVERVHACPQCGYFCEGELCEICADPTREPALLCVVEEAFQVGAIDRTGRYKGRFHVLGGRLSPLDGVGPESLNIGNLVERVRALEPGTVEVILATNTSVEGEATAVYLENLLRPFTMRVTRLARGLPMGSDLEYVDGTTLAEALRGRREM